MDVSVGRPQETTDDQCTYDRVQDVQCRQALCEKDHDFDAGVQVHLTQAIAQGNCGSPAEDERPEQGRDCVVANEVSPLRKSALEDAHISDSVMVGARGS